MLAKVCHNVSVEPHLQPLNGKEMTLTTAIREDSARLDVKANGFWGLYTRSTKGKRGEPIIKEFCKSNTAPFHPWSSPPLEEWDEQQQESTREWLT